MKNLIKNLIKNFYKHLLYGHRATSQSYTKYLRKKGVEIGNNVTFYEPNTNYIDDQKPFLISIGNNVEITRGVTVITHDYSWSVIKHLTGEIIGSRAPVTIGDNVFIGMNTIILKGVTIGDNVIIGAGSVITKNIPPNSIACGNPARVIGSYDQYYKKRKRAYLDEAVQMFQIYYQKNQAIPPREIFDEFFWLFESRDKSAPLNTAFLKKMELTGNLSETEKSFLESSPQFDSYQAFIDYCINRIKHNNYNLQK